MKRRRIAFIFIALCTTYIGAQLWDIHRIGYLSRDRSGDCAIVLGAAAWHNKPSPVLRERLNHAIELYQHGKVQALLLTGGYGEGADFSESAVGLEYSVSQGIPRDRIFSEEQSLSTLANLKEAKKIMDQKHWKTALLVSDPWHLKRARRMAADIGITVFASGTPSSRYESTKARMIFLLKEFYLYHLYLLTGE